MEKMVYENGVWRIDQYKHYLDSVRDKLPAGATAFFDDPAHYDIQAKRTPYACWVESLVINETGMGERQDVRQLEITATFLGAYHDEKLVVSYKNVDSYSLSLASGSHKEAKIGHGYWVIDELLVKPGNLISHEIHFSDGASIHIICADLEHWWEPR